MLLTNMNKKTTMPNSINLINAPDLTRRPPRSPRVRLGGYAILPRMLDKGRATLAGKNGEYHFNCPLDQRFLNFVGIDPEALQDELGKGKGDGEILDWITQNQKHQHSEFEIAAWSEFQERRAPADNESRGYFSNILEKAAPKREDVASWFELLDLDDYASFGGRA